MKDDSELKAILPEHSLDTDIKEHVRSRQGKSRTKVRFITVDSEQRLCNEDAVFIFDEDYAIRQAAEHAAAHFSNSGTTPFDDLFVYLEDEKGKKLAVKDLNVNVHNLFQSDDTMIVANHNLFERENLKYYFMMVIALSFGIIMIGALVVAILYFVKFLSRFAPLY
ncbi:CIC11C00000003990 [Sungouiella intermedia]|uniref:CIC11C00000003990 n=1 Tax=Sungouiella intermedia TaxID=45354 RepID=A0A1L0DMI7_9ASCO|nr:CIC11C00000003990 [[Candida] intermedia]